MMKKRCGEYWDAGDKHAQEGAFIGQTKTRKGQLGRRYICSYRLIR